MAKPRFAARSWRLAWGSSVDVGQLGQFFVFGKSQISKHMGIVQHMWVSIAMEVPQKWMVDNAYNITKMDDSAVPPFREPPHVLKQPQICPVPCIHPGSCRKANRTPSCFSRLVSCIRMLQTLKRMGCSPSMTWCRISQPSTVVS